jgi:methylated-DNA-[protein]-cysteine S-methyltransferase
MGVSGETNEVGVAWLKAPFGWVRLSATAQALTGIDLLPPEPRTTIPDQGAAGENPILAAAACELQQYFDDPDSGFTLPIVIEGTPYQRRVWSELGRIQSGKALSYAELAQRLSSGARAVAAACKANRFPILIPCHRVVSVSGLGGFCGTRAGKMMDIKRWLLAHEGYL